MFRLAITTAALAAALATTASTAQPEGGLEERLAGLTPGAERTCINFDQVTYTRTFEQGILFVAGRNKLWFNKPGPGCENGLRREELIVSRSLNGQYCSGDRVETRVRTGGMVSGACTLNAFVPYTKQAAAK